MPRSTNYYFFVFFGRLHILKRVFCERKKTAEAVFLDSQHYFTSFPVVPTVNTAFIGQPLRETAERLDLYFPCGTVRLPEK